MIAQYKKIIVKLDSISSTFNNRMNYLEGFAQAAAEDSDEHGEKRKLTVASGVSAEIIQLETDLKKLLTDLENLKK